MRDKSNQAGAKAQVRATKERERRVATAIFLAIIILIAAISAYFTYTFLNQPQNQTINPTSSQPKAAIADPLSLTFPNQTFIETATNTLKQAGYTVDYYPGEEVNVEFYRNLPTHDYDIIILRVHSAMAHPESQNPTHLALFTSEPYTTRKYVSEQLDSQLWRAVYFEGGLEYFGIGPRFVSFSMKGRFNNTTVIMMGCEGLKYPVMAQAITNKGAKVYIGWDKEVSANHTDQATIHLLQNLLIKTQTIEQAVSETMKEVGPDPICKSVLTYYPPETGDQKIEDTKTGH